MLLTRAVLHVAAPIPDLDVFHRYLFIAPHADDCELGAGATIARLCAEGKEVFLLICTDGRYGNSTSGLAPEQLALVRKKEAAQAAQFLGAGVRFLDLCDGGFYTFDELYMGIARAISDLQPEVVFGPDPCLSSECHVDHLNVGEAVRRAVNAARNREIYPRLGFPRAEVSILAYYATAHPDTYVRVTDSQIRKQIAALSCHESQCPHGSRQAMVWRRYIRLRALDAGIRSGKGRAEGFRVLDRQRMHGLPEAGD